MWSVARTNTHTQTESFSWLVQVSPFFSFPPHYHRGFSSFPDSLRFGKEKKRKRNVVSDFSLIYYAGQSNRCRWEWRRGEQHALIGSRAPERGGRSVGDGGRPCRIAGVAGLAAHQSLRRPRRCRQIHLAGTSHVVSTCASVAGHPAARPQSKTSSSLVI